MSSRWWLNAALCRFTGEVRCVVSDSRACQKLKGVISLHALDGRLEGRIKERWLKYKLVSGQS